MIQTGEFQMIFDRLLYVMIILAHDRRKIVRFDVTPYPTAGWLSRSRGTLRRAICCAIATPHMASNSASKSMRWGSQKSSRHHAPRGRMRTSNA